MNRVSSLVLLPPTQNLTVAKYAEGFGYSAVEWEAALSAIDWERDAEPLKDGRKGSVWRATVTLDGLGQDCVLKVEPLRTPWKRAKAWVCATKAHQQWRGVGHLRRYGLAAARPRVILRAADAEALILEWVPGSMLLGLLAGQGDRVPYGTIAHELAGGALELALAKVELKDPKLSNVVVDLGSHDAARVVYIDTVGVRRSSMTPDELLSRWLARIRAELRGTGIDDRHELITTTVSEIAGMLWYARAEVDPTKRDRASADSIAEAMWDRSDELLKAHGDPTPKDDPLARPELPR